MLFFILIFITAVIHSILAIAVGYLVFLSLVSLKVVGVRKPARLDPAARFAILIPAHNEEVLLPVLLRSLGKMNYPHPMYSIYVIADNCTDQTAQIAASEGASVFPRFNDAMQGKGYALTWGFQQIEASGAQFDALVVLDADSTVSANFLQVMDQLVSSGERVIQAYYSVQSPAEQWTGAIRYAAFTGVHYLRPLAREALRTSVGLKGNGMVFRWEVLRQHSWSGSLTEDIDFHMSLILAGERVAFAPEAVVWAEMPNSLENSRSQHARWERGRLQMAKKYAGRLLSNAWRAVQQKKFQQGFLFVDAAMELLIPPVSILVAAVSTLIVVNSLLLAGYQIGNNWTAQMLTPWLLINTLFSLFLFVGVFLYIFIGLRLAKAPGAVYRSLVMAPRYLLWKVRQYAGISIQKGRENDHWIRTTRN